MSEGKNVLVVPDDLSRILVREQLKKLGISLDVIVNPDAARSMVIEMLSANDTRDEMAGIMKNSQYAGDFRSDHLLLVKNIAKEFNNFCAFHKFKALRDSTIGGLSYAFAQGPDSGGNPALQDSQREASVSTKAPDEIVPTLLTEMLKELKVIKHAVTHPVVEIDLGAEPETPAFGLKECLEFIYRNPDLVKDHLKEPTPGDAGLQGTSTSIWKQTHTRVVLEKLIEAIGSDEVGSVTLHDLKLIDSRVKRNLHAALKTALVKYDELDARDKKFYVVGEEHLPKEVSEGNMAFTLGIFTNLWAQAALEKGIELDQSSLVNHLLKPGAATLTNITGGGIVIGNRTLTLNKDGSLKIVTQLPNNTVSFVVINADGAVILHGPGYMG